MPTDNPLGQQTQYVNQYDASLLFPIKRTESRQYLGLTGELPFSGEDRWTAYEVSWLDALGKPQVRIAEFVIPAESPNIVESKSCKLYLNSLNQTVFENEQKVLQTVSDDLSKIIGAEISLQLLPLDNTHSIFTQQSVGVCLDERPIKVIHYKPTPDVLAVSNSLTSNEIVFSHLLKTNCPITDQPDWATIFIEYTGRQINHDSLLKYVISFREHQDYHENSVEKIFCDIQHYCQPEQLCVYARYLRRGGLDINPLRSSYPKGKSILETQTLRTLRQ